MQKLRDLNSQYEIDGIRKLIWTYRNNEVFKSKWKGIWGDIAKEEGGKISLTTIGLIFGASLGGVGFAAMGSAFGLPLAGILGLSGLISGSKIDNMGLFGDKKPIEVEIPIELHSRLKDISSACEVSVSELVEYAIVAIYGDFK